jgi:hypothetical protein
MKTAGTKAILPASPDQGIRNSPQGSLSGSLPAQDATAEVASWASAGSASRVLDAMKWVFSFPAMLGSFLVGAAFYAAHQFFLDPDVWWHIRDGQAILSTHHWPTLDPYSFTVNGQPWIAFEWLGDVLLAWVMRVGGVRAFEVWLFALGSAILLALYAYGTICSGKSKAGFLATALVAPLAMAQFNMRPQMLGYLLLLLTLIILKRFRQEKTRTIWLLPLLFAIWVNAHGSWIIGMGAFVVYCVSGFFEFRVGGIEAKKWSVSERRQMLLAFLVSLAVLPLNPYGTELPAFPFKVGAGYPVSHANIVEWFPMPFNETWAKVFLFLLLGFIVAQVALQLTWSIEELFLCLFGMGMACMHIRFLLLFVPFFTPLSAAICGRWLSEYARVKDKYVLNAILMAGLAAGILHYYPSRAYLEKKLEAQFPVKAVEYLQQHPVAGRMLNSYGFGGYLVWIGQRVFVDGRSELYEDGGVLSDYMQLATLRPGGLDVLRRYQIQSCLLGRDEPLAVVLGALPDWQKIYSDHTSALFVRRGALSSTQGSSVETSELRGRS